MGGMGDIQAGHICIMRGIHRTANGSTSIARSNRCICIKRPEDKSMLSPVYTLARIGLD